jgi:predicted small lipoprotein YifL
MPNLTRDLRAGLILLLIALALAGCGKKGNPQPPPDEPNTYPRTYPSE